MVRTPGFARGAAEPAVSEMERAVFGLLVLVQVLVFRDKSLQWLHAVEDAGQGRFLTKKIWSRESVGNGRRLEPGGSRKRQWVGTTLLRQMDDADHGGQPALNPGGALARAQRLDTVVIRQMEGEGSVVGHRLRTPGTSQDVAVRLGRLPPLFWKTNPAWAGARVLTGAALRRWGSRPPSSANAAVHRMGHGPVPRASGFDSRRRLPETFQATACQLS